MVQKATATRLLMCRNHAALFGFHAATLLQASPGLEPAELAEALEERMSEYARCEHGPCGMETCLLVSGAGGEEL